MDHLYDLLEAGRAEIDNAMEAKGYTSKLTKIWKDDQKVVDLYPSIRLVAAPKEVAWAATRVRDETYNFYVDCMAKILKKEEAARFIRCFGSAVQNWLNDFLNLRKTIRDTQIMIWDSFAPRVEYGYVHNGALRVARVTWFCKTSNPVTV